MRKKQDDQKAYDEYYASLEALKACEIKVKPYDVPALICRLDKYEALLTDVFGVPAEMIEPVSASIGGFVNMMQSSEGVQIPVCALPKKYSELVVWHEALHLTLFILDLVGVRHDAENHEVVCYTQGHIVDEIRQQFYGRKPL